MLIWINWGGTGTTESQEHMRVTASGTILTRTPIPRANLYLAVRFTTGSDAMRVVAASALACDARPAITLAFRPWGRLVWPTDPAEFLNNDASPVEEPLPVFPPPTNRQPLGPPP